MTCTFCGLTFNTIVERIDHERLVHDPNKWTAPPKGIA